MSKPVQESAKEWSLGCVKRAPAARGSQGAGITQPRDHSLADPCTGFDKLVTFLWWHSAQLSSDRLRSSFFEAHLGISTRQRSGFVGRQITRISIDSNDFHVRKSKRGNSVTPTLLKKGFFRDRVVKARNEITVTRRLQTASRSCNVYEIKVVTRPVERYLGCVKQ